MIELKFIAERYDGQLVGGVVSAEGMKLAKERAVTLAEQNNLKIKSYEKKSIFIYVVRKGNEKPVKGEQAAFNKAEVIDAFNRLGYEIISVRKKFFQMNIKPSDNDILMFVKVSADMLEHNLSYGEILSFIISDTRNKVLKEAIKDINKELKTGADNQLVFMKHQGVLGKFTAFMLGLASKSGNMAEIYRSTAKFMERRIDFKKSLRSALITPMVTLFVLFAAVVWYVGYIFPQTAKLFQKFHVKLPPMTAFTLQVSDFLSDNILIIIALIIIPIILGWRYARTEKGKLLLDQYILKIPLLGELLHKTLIEIFCRVFYTLYSGSAESITPIKVAAEATGNSYFETSVKNITIPKMTSRGVGISDGLFSSGVFTETAISKFRAGEETGNIKGTTLQLADYYESDTTYRLKNFVEWVQIGIAMIILVVMILLTLVSAETAIVQPKMPGVTYSKDF